MPHNAATRSLGTVGPTAGKGRPIAETPRLGSTAGPRDPAPSAKPSASSNDPGKRYRGRSKRPAARRRMASETLGQLLHLPGRGPTSVSAVTTGQAQPQAAPPPREFRAERRA